MRSLCPILLLAFTPFSSFAAEPFARAAIEDGGAIVPGQQVRLDVTVYAPDFFTSPPQFPLFDLPNAVVTLPDQRAQNLVETVDGVQYSGIRRVYALVPETSGSFSLPMLTIELGYSASGKSFKGEARTPEFSFTVGEPVSPSGTTLAFAASNLTLTQTFDRDPGSLTVGDALVRTITVFAEDTQAMMIPAVDVGQSVGLKQYDANPVVEDNVSIGRQTGSRRTQSVTYTAGVSGGFVIPPVSYSWYDIDERRQAIATLPSTKISSMVAPAPMDGIAPQLLADPDARHVPRKRVLVTIITLMLLTFGFFIWYLRSWLVHHARIWIDAYRQSEGQRFGRLMKTVRTGKPEEIEAGLRLWSVKKGYQSPTEWASGDVSLLPQITRLQHYLYGDRTVHLDRDALAQALLASNRIKKRTRRKRSHLPALNP